MCHWDAVFYIIFQLAGGLLAVYFMQFAMGNLLTAAPVHSVVTVPGKQGIVPVLLAETLIAFLTMTMVLFTSSHERLKKYTRIIAAILVCCWVIFAGPVSGFGMNPARTIASALPSGIWTGWWIYLFAPLTGMLLAAEVFLFTKRNQYIKSFV
jgi:aquaporin Z